MVDNFAVFGIVVRTIAGVILAMVIHLQLKQFKNKTVLQGLKRLLLLSVVTMFVVNAFGILVNLFRATDGNLLEDVRHISTIFNPSATLLIAVSLYMVYQFHDEDDE